MRAQRVNMDGRQQIAAALLLSLIEKPMPPHRIRLEQCQPQRNRFRFYSLSLEPNLFGGWSLVRQWGRIGQTGRMHADLYATELDAQAAMAHKVQQKRRRGYS